MKTISLLFAIAAPLILLTGVKAKSNHEEGPALKHVTILIIRHAEKPENGRGLAPAGEKRARAYVDYFQKLLIDEKPLHLDYLISSADSEESQRPRLTIEPLSKALELKIDDQFKDKQFAELARDLQSKPHGKNILICWHHGEIPSLLRALGANPDQLLPNGKWPNEVFGWAIELRFNHEGQLTESKRLDEKLMPDDSRK